MSKKIFDKTRQYSKIKTENRIPDKPEILWMNDYVITNSSALKFFRFDNQKYKNRKPDRKPDPGPEKNFPQKLRNYIMSLMPHNFFQLTESIKSYEANGA